MGSRGSNDPSNGYDAIAGEFMRHREASGIGVATVLAWARQLPPGAAVLDLGCGSGAPVAVALDAAGFAVHGVDASPRLVAAFRRRLPWAPVACEAVDASPFFGRRFDGVVAVGLMFLLEPRAQCTLIGRIAGTLVPGGRFLFTAPEQACTWTDTLTGRRSRSLGTEAYAAAAAAVGLQAVGGYRDEGGNRYHELRRGAAQARMDEVAAPGTGR